MIKDHLTQEIDCWSKLGHAALMQRFVLRNGKQFEPTKRIGRKRRAKMCFANSYGYVLRDGGTYVEGYAINKDCPLLLIHHAWVTLDGVTAMDLTLDADEYEYWGIAFDEETLRTETVKNGYYSLLDPGGIFPNTKLMFGMDPELQAICAAVKADYKLEKDREKTGRL